MPKEQDTLYYSVTLDNTSYKDYRIKSVEPVINSSLKELLISNQTIIIKEPKRLEKNRDVEFGGHFEISTIKLSKDEIIKLLPIIKEYKIVYDNDKEIIMKTLIN